MKTIIENAMNQSKYIFEDNVELIVEETRITTPNFIIGDLNSNNSTIIENVTPPNDWKGCKYLYQDNNWVLNPSYTEPIVAENI